MKKNFFIKQIFPAIEIKDKCHSRRFSYYGKSNDIGQCFCQFLCF